MTNNITWHADATVAARAVFGGHEALVTAAWGTEPARWWLYRVGGLDPIADGTAADLDGAKAFAEAALRDRAP
jgi:hypothetical protein